MKRFYNIMINNNNDNNNNNNNNDTIVSQPTKRKANRFKCDGSCKKGKKCTYEAERKKDVDKHQGKQKSECPKCKKIYCSRQDKNRHYRKQHPECINLDGSSKDKSHGIPPTGSSPIKCPAKFSNHEKYGKMLDKGGGYQFVVDLVKTQLEHDLDKKGRYTDEQVKYCKEVYGDNKKYHAKAYEIVKHLISKNLLDNDATDEAGGRLKNGFILRSHGGLFKLSLDRKNNKLPHFLPPNEDGSIPSFDANLRLVAGAMNTQANIICRYGKETCEKICKVVTEQRNGTKLITKKQIDSVLEEVVVKGTRSKLYLSCQAIFQNDKKCQKEFKTRRKFYEHMLRILKEQLCQCPINGLLVLNDTDEEDKWRQMSVDAIYPCKGHVRGNLQVICLYTNNVNMDNLKQYHDESDPQSVWTPITHDEYMGIKIKIEDSKQHAINEKIKKKMLIFNICI